MAAKTKGSLYLLDISHFTFRAYHALPPLTTSAGLATNAVHGVVNMLERLIREHKPDYLAAVFDSGRKTFRNDIYPDYKANRDEPDEDLRVQFPLVRQVVEAMGIACLEREGFEADDILATVAHRLGGKGSEVDQVVIVTADKDLMQCVGGNVTLLDPVRDKRVGREEVREKFGVGPEAVTDVQGLMGDSSDNIPGIRGIGPKTASALIAHFGSLEALLERSDEIEGMSIRGAKGVMAKVEGGIEAARVSKLLATVRNDIDLDLELDDLVLGSAENVALLELAERLEMGRLSARLRKALGAEAAPPPKPPRAARAKGQAKADEAAQEKIEVKSRGDWQALCGGEVLVAFGEDEFGRPLLGLGKGKRTALVAGEAEVAACLQGLADSQTSLCGHGLKSLCRRFGVPPGPAGLDFGLASYLYDSSSGDHGESAVSRRFLGQEPEDGAGSAEERLMGSLDRAVRLRPLLREALAERGQTALYEDLEHPLLPVLAAIESCGMQLDCELLGGMSKELASRMTSLVGKIYKSAGVEFNVLSPLQLREVLYEKLGLPTKGIKKTKTGLSTDSATLEGLIATCGHELPRLILDYRGLAKLKSTYVDALPRLVDGDGRIHTTLNQTVTATGRLSSSDPNLQNIPIRTPDGARIRRAFVAPAGKVLVSADYNQIELRVLAHLAGDEALVAAFAEGRDIHAATAEELFAGQGGDPAARRREAKVVNYGLIYGMGSTRLARELGISRSQAAAYIERYFERYAGVRSFYQRMLEQARENGYVSTLAGRRRYLADINSEHGGLRQVAERVATNTPIQGTAADIIKKAMIDLVPRLRAEGLAAAMVLQIHDELLIECPQDESDQVVRLLCEVMEGAADLAVPLVVDAGAGATWAEAHG
ncbi:MAG: DNA polymerase I [Deltaproteobacteria bacterium]